MIRKYQKKPVIIEAVQFDGKNFDEIQNWSTAHFIPLTDGTFVIPTLEGDMKASLGDFIIKGVNGEFYPCKPDIFENTYSSCVVD